MGSLWYKDRTIGCDPPTLVAEPASSTGVDASVPLAARPDGPSDVGTCRPAGSGGAQITASCSAEDGTGCVPSISSPLGWPSRWAGVASTGASGPIDGCIAASPAGDSPADGLSSTAASMVAEAHPSAHQPLHTCASMAGAGDGDDPSVPEAADATHGDAIVNAVDRHDDVGPAGSVTRLPRARGRDCSPAAEGAEPRLPPSPVATRLFFAGGAGRQRASPLPVRRATRSRAAGGASHPPTAAAAGGITTARK